MYVMDAGDLSDFSLRWVSVRCYTRALYNIRYPSEIHIKLKSREISFAHNSCFSWPIALKLCAEHGSIIAVLCAKFQTDWTNEISRDLSLRWVSDGYPIFHSTPDYIRITSWFALHRVTPLLWEIFFTHVFNVVNIENKIIGWSIVKTNEQIT